MGWGEASAPHPDPRVRVAGWCPMGCGETLYVGAGGKLTCSAGGCPDPYRVSAVLDEDQHRHLVTFTDTGFSIRHPLAERVPVDAIESCSLHAYLAGLDAPPVRPGRYLAVLELGRWVFAEEVRS